MLEIFQQNPWLLIVLGAFCIPITAILIGGVSMVLLSGQRRAALRVLERYAEQGKDPPPEVLAAVSWGGGRRRRYYAPPPPPSAPDAGADPTAREEARAAREEWRQEWRDGWRRYRRNEPLRTWRRAFTLGALAGAFYFGAQYIAPHAQGGFVIAAIIIGALAVATLLSAIITTIFRDK